MFTISTTDNTLHTYTFISSLENLTYDNIPSDEVILGIKVIIPDTGTTFIIGESDYEGFDVEFVSIDYHVGDKQLKPELLGTTLEFYDGCESVDLSSLS